MKGTNEWKFLPNNHVCVNEALVVPAFRVWIMVSVFLVALP